MFRLSNLSSLQLFQLLRYAAFLLIGVCFAKLHLPQTDIGRFETFILVSGMLSFFWVSGIINSMLSIYPRKNDEEKRAILFNTFISLGGLSFLAGIILYTFSGNILAFMDKEGTGSLIQLSVVYLLFNNPSFLIEYILYLNEHKKAVILYGAVSALLSIVAAVVPVLLHYPIEFAVYGLIGVAILRLVLTVALLAKYTSFKLNGTLLLEHLKLSTPVILSIFVSGSAEYVDGIIIKSKFDDMFFAVYRYGAKELPILLILANTFSTAMIPVVAASLEEGLAEIKQRSANLMHVLFPITIVLLLTSQYLYPLVFSKSFTYSALIFNIYLLLIVPRLVFPQTILTGMQQTRWLLISSIIEITINISLSIYLAGKIGLPGVAAGTLVAYCIDKLFLVLVAKFYFNISPEKYLKIIPYLVYVTLTFVAFAVGYVMMMEL